MNYGLPIVFEIETDEAKRHRLKMEQRKKKKQEKTRKKNEKKQFKMKKQLIFILLFIICLGSNAQTKIPWSKEVKLKWSDFKAKPNLDIFGYAQTSYKIKIIPEDILVDENNNIKNFKSLDVVTNFYTNHSWVYKEDEYLLKHEQLHFDIAELYSQKIRIEFNKLKVQKIANFDVYWDIYQKLWQECGKVQKNYDEETSHGLKKDINDNWIDKISSELNKN